MSFEGKSQQEIGKWTEYCLKKENGPRASSAPALELNTIIFKQEDTRNHEIGQLDNRQLLWTGDIRKNTARSAELKTTGDSKRPKEQY